MVAIYYINGCNVEVKLHSVLWIKIIWFHLLLIHRLFPSVFINSEKDYPIKWHKCNQVDKTENHCTLRPSGTLSSRLPMMLWQKNSCFSFLSKTANEIVITKKTSWNGKNLKLCFVIWRKNCFRWILSGLRFGKIFQINLEAKSIDGSCSIFFSITYISFYSFFFCRFSCFRREWLALIQVLMI